MNEKSNKSSIVEEIIKENLIITCPEYINESVMNEIRVDYFKSVRKINPRFVFAIILISSLLMIGLLILFALVQFPDIGDKGIVGVSFTFLEIPKFFTGIWKLKYFPIFIISFSLIIFIDIFFFKKKKSLYL